MEIIRLAIFVPVCKALIASAQNASRLIGL